MASGHPVAVFVTHVPGEAGSTLFLGAITAYVESLCLDHFKKILLTVSTQELQVFQ